jgi:hypothetical protein
MSPLSAPDQTLKHCSRCGLDKIRGEFYRNKTTKDGLSFWCKTCTKSVVGDNYRSFGRSRAEQLALRRLARRHPEEFAELFRKELAKIRVARDGQPADTADGAAEGV